MNDSKKPKERHTEKWTGFQLRQNLSDLPKKEIKLQNILWHLKLVSVSTEHDTIGLSAIPTREETVKFVIRVKVEARVIAAGTVGLGWKANLQEITNNNAIINTGILTTDRKYSRHTTRR